jgi:hypothetical protein
MAEGRRGGGARGTGAVWLLDAASWWGEDVGFGWRDGAGDVDEGAAGVALYAAAADRDQARLFIDSIRGYAVRTPELRGALRVDAYKVTAPGDVVLEALAADGPSTWGLRPFMLLIDEVCQWPSTPSTSMFYEALTSAILKMDGARMVLCSSAGDPVHWSRKVLDHALESELWRVSEVPGPLEWTDPVKLEEQQKRLPPSSFRRLHLNQWASAEDRLVDPDDLQACVTLEGPVAPEPGLKYVVGLDIGLRNDATVAAVLHKDRDGRLVLDRMEVWAPVKGQTVELSTVEAWLELTCRAYNHAEICFDPYQAIALSQRLRAQGIRTSEYQFTAASVGRLAEPVPGVARAPVGANQR